MTPTEKPLIVRLSSPPDIVGAIPSFVGFHPSESLVILCLHGPRNRSGLTMRVDLPEPAVMHEYVTEMASRVASEDTDAVIIACYTQGPDVEGELPRADLVAMLLDELGLRDIGWLEALLVRAERWWSYTCTKPCCPREGTPLPASPSNTVTELEARRAMEGIAVLPGREDLAKSINGPVALRLFALQQRFDEIGALVADQMLDDGLETVRGETLRLAHAMLERFITGGHEIDDADAVRILIGLQDKWSRDVLITWGLDSRREDVLAFLTALAQCAPDQFAAPICTVLAAVAYQHGGGALTSVALERALQHEPDYEMAMILDSLLAGQVHPREVRAMSRRVQRELHQSGIDVGGHQAA